MSFLGGLFGGGMSYDPYTGKLGQSVEDQRRFVEALNAQTPEAIAAQRQLLGQLQQQAAGQGPSVAQTSLNRAMGQGTAGISAALAGQRGSAANVGLTGRNIASVGAQQQQDLAAQGAVLKAQEQMAARKQLGDLAGQQIGQVQTGLAQEAGTAGNLEQLKTQTELQKAKTQGNVFGNILGAAGTILNPVGALAGQALAGAFRGRPGETMGPAFATGGYVDEFKKGMLAMAHGGKVPAMVSPGEKYLPPSEVEKVAMGQKPVAKAGEMIPGKAKVAGDSLKNDTVKKTLTEGGIVIPRTVMQSPNPEEQARKFVASVLAKQKMKRK